MVADHEVETAVSKLGETVVVDIADMIDRHKGVGGNFREEFGRSFCIYGIEIVDRCSRGNVGGFMEGTDFESAPGERGVDGIAVWSWLHG